MPRTRLNLENTEENKLRFVGRDNIIKELFNEIISTTLKEHSINVYYGMGGIGKTRLINELRKYLDINSQRTIHVKLDFRQFENRTSSTALIRLRSKLKAPFPSFDLAFTAYWKMLNPHVPISNNELKFLHEGEITGEVISILSEIPVIGFAAKIPRLIGKASKKTKQWWTKRGNNELKNILNKDEPNEIAEWLPVLWASDLKNWILENNKKVVLIFDTYEALWEGEKKDSRGLSSDDWIREFASHLQGVNIVIIGQRKIDWIKSDQSWQGIINQNKLIGLEKKDVLELLSFYDIVDQKIVDLIFKKSNGVPVFLVLAINLYKEITSLPNNRKPTPSDFNFDLRGIVKHFLSFKSDSQKAALFVLSVPRKFDYILFKELMSEFNTGYQSDHYSFENLSTFTELETNEKGEFLFHNLIRETLEKIDNIKSRKEVHKHLFKKHIDRLKQIDLKKINLKEKDYLLEAIYHAKQCLKKEKFDNWFNEIIELLDDLLEWEFIIQLRRLCDEYFIVNFGALDLKTLSNKQQIANKLYFGGRKYKEAENILENIISDLKKSQSKETICFLKATRDLGDVMRSTGRLTQATEKLNYVIEHIDSEDKELLEIKCSTLNNLSIIYTLENNHEIAKELLESALLLSQKIDETDIDVLTIKSNYAMTLEKLGEYNDAFELAEKCYKIVLAKYGKNHPNTLHQKAVLIRIDYANGQDSNIIIHNLENLVSQEIELLGLAHAQTLDTMSLLANIFMDEGQNKKSEELFRKILVTKLEFLGASTSSTFFSNFELAEFLFVQNRFDEAEEIFNNLISQAKEFIDEDHPMILNAKSKFAFQLMDAGKYDKSLKLYEEVISFRRQKLGLKNPLTINSINYLGQIHAMLHNFKKAEAFFSEALKLRLKYFPDSYSLIGSCYNNLGNLYSRLGKYSEAEECLDKAYNLTLKECEIDGNEVLKVKGNIALNYFNWDRYEDAHTIWLELFYFRLEKDGIYHRETATVLANLISAYKSENKIKEAESLFNLIEEEITNIDFDNNSMFYTTLPISIANLYYLNSEQTKATELLKKVIHETKEKYELTSDLTRIAISDLVDIFNETKQFHLIPAFCQDWFKICKKIYGKNHELIQRPIEEHLDALLKIGDLKNANRISKNLLSIKKTIYASNESSLKILWSQIQCAQFNIWLGDFNEADKFLNEAKEFIDKYSATSNYLSWYYNCLSKLQEHKGNIEKGEEILLKSLEILQNDPEINKDSTIPRIISLYHFYYRRGMINTSNSYFMKAMNIAESISEKAIQFVENQKINVG